jgi:hypothetical protein
MRRVHAKNGPRVAAAAVMAVVVEAEAGVAAAAAGVVAGVDIVIGDSPFLERVRAA